MTLLPGHGLRENAVGQAGGLRWAASPLVYLAARATCPGGLMSADPYLSFSPAASRHAGRCGGGSRWAGRSGSTYTTTSARWPSPKAAGRVPQGASPPAPRTSARRASPVSTGAHGVSRGGADRWEVGEMHRHGTIGLRPQNAPARDDRGSHDWRSAGCRTLAGRLQMRRPRGRPWSQPRDGALLTSRGRLLG